MDLQFSLSARYSSSASGTARSTVSSWPLAILDVFLNVLPRIRVEIALNLVKVSDLLQMKLLSCRSRTDVGHL